jgi:murein DD-endopeptidase MepM/ murein hydrolase activator NlpD
MAKIKYYYDTETCRYEPVKTTKTDVLWNLLGFLSVSLIAGLGFGWLFMQYFPGKQLLSLRKENEQLVAKYSVVEHEMEKTQNMLSVLQKRDDKLYRAILEAKPVPAEVRNGGTGGSETFKALLEERLEREDLVLGTFKKLDRLKRQLYVQTKSYDELVELTKNKSKMLASIPAIQPMQKNLMTFASGFGMRMHPILKHQKMHTGCDFSAAKGAPIYATGDGVIIQSGYDQGYGLAVEIDHGFGYVTKYAHMSVTKMRRGQKVKRGQEIGKVGSTGLSVSPHLHYEVIYKGKHVNPIHYFFNDLSPQEYKEIIEVAAEDRQSLGGN